PFGPMSPTMRPSSTRRSTLLRTTSAPNALRRPRASMHAICSGASFLFRPGVPAAAAEEFINAQTEPLDGFLNLRPFFRNELLALSLQQELARPLNHEHPEPAPCFNQTFVDEFLITLEDRERIHAILRRHAAH